MRDRDLQIEARLERSLHRQVKVPRLDGRFDAAVWSRIAAEEEKAKAPRAQRGRAPRWLVACNFIGIAVSVVLVAVFASRAVSGVDLGVDMNVSLPSFSAEQQSLLIKKMGPIVSAAAVLFGFMFTRHGRRLISALR